MRRAGFTLVEMIAAVALTGLLMVALLQTTASLGVTRRAWDAAAQDPRRSVPPDWLDRWRTTLDREAAAARRVVIEPEAVLRLEGHIGRHPATGEMTYEPAIVRYRYVTDSPAPSGAADGAAAQLQGLVLREEQWLLSVTDAPPQVRLVAAGVSAWSVAYADTGEPSDAVEDGAREAEKEIEVLVEVGGVAATYRIGVPSREGSGR